MLPSRVVQSNATATKHFTELGTAVVVFIGFLCENSWCLLAATYVLASISKGQPGFRKVSSLTCTGSSSSSVYVLSVWFQLALAGSSYFLAAAASICKGPPGSNGVLHRQQHQ